MKQLLFLLAFFLFSISCNVTKNRPIEELPDGNNDRIEKEIFSGSSQDPKYWMGKVTVVNTDFNENPLLYVFPGLQSQAFVGWFEFERDTMAFYNAVTRQNLEDPNTAQEGRPQLINSWPIEHSQVRLKEIDGWTINQEEENRYIPWDQKTHFRVKWDQAIVSESATFPQVSLAELLCWRKIDSHLIDQSRELTNDYISFVVAISYERDPKCANPRQITQGDYTFSIHYKYSFMRVGDPRIQKSDDGYTPYVYEGGEQDPLNQKYGYFQTIRPVIAEDNRDKNMFLMNRWHPNKKHTFYFSKNYPEEYKAPAHGVICAVNKLFARHSLNNYPLNGTCGQDGIALPSEGETCTKGICFELKENTGQQLGDIRYSFFHVLSSKMGGLAGYGPSDTHPATGEITGANVMISVYSFDFWLNVIQERLERDQEHKNKISQSKWETSPLFLRMKNTLQELDHAHWTRSSKNIDHNSKIRADFEYLLSQFTFGDPLRSRFTASAREINSGEQALQRLSLLLDQFAPDALEEITSATGKELASIQDDKSINAFEGEEKSAQSLKKSRSHPLFNDANTVIYPLQPLLAQAGGLLAGGLSKEEVKQRIFFQLITHEFGHVLNLRHNFYGSLDSSHWMRDEQGHVERHSSSVMDYLRLKDEASAPLKAVFGAYDEAALVYAYSGGAKDMAKEKGDSYLFCTDHHEALNFLCNKFDEGETPSQVMQSLIENYEENWFISNFRMGRAFWSSNGYPRFIFNQLLDIKRALMMWEGVFKKRDLIAQTLYQSPHKAYQEEDVNFIFQKIGQDIHRALTLSIAFYYSVIKMSNDERSWRSQYDNPSGSLEQIGILWDKIFSMFFLLGDQGFVYNPNDVNDNASYLTYSVNEESLDMINYIIQDLLVKRPDMMPNFIELGRVLYAQNASNFYNVKDNSSLLDKIGVQCYTPAGLESRFNLTEHSFPLMHNKTLSAEEGEYLVPTDQSAFTFPLKKLFPYMTDPYFRSAYNDGLTYSIANGGNFDSYNEQLGGILHGNSYYVASSEKNAYAFAIVNRLKEIYMSPITTEDAQKTNQHLAKKDLRTMYNLYHYFLNGAMPEGCIQADNRQLINLNPTQEPEEPTPLPPSYKISPIGNGNATQAP